MSAIRFLSLVFGIALFAGCKDDAEQALIDEACPENFTCEYKFERNVSLEVEDGQLDLVSKPGYTLFHFSARFQDDPQIADDELTESVVFQMSTQANNFMYHDLTIQPVYYTRSCYCSGDNAVKINDGYLHGTRKSDNEWSVTGHITFTANGRQKEYTLEDKSFRLK